LTWSCDKTDSEEEKDMKDLERKNNDISLHDDKNYNEKLSISSQLREELQEITILGHLPM